MAWEFASDHANDLQPRDGRIDQVIATVSAARARQEAVRLNRVGDYDRARNALRATARKIRGYAGKGPELHRIMRELMAESEQFHRVMPERMRKEHYARSHRQMRSRDFEGKAMRRAPQA